MASDCEVRTLSSIGSEIKSWCKQNKEIGRAHV